MKLQLNDIQFTRVSRGKYGYLSIGLRVKPEDYSNAQREMLERILDDGLTCDLTLNLKKKKTSKNRP